MTHLPALSLQSWQGRCQRQEGLSDWRNQKNIERKAEGNQMETRWQPKGNQKKAHPRGQTSIFPIGFLALFNLQPVSTHQLGSPLGKDVLQHGLQAVQVQILTNDLIPKPRPCRKTQKIPAVAFWFPFETVGVKDLVSLGDFQAERGPKGGFLFLLANTLNRWFDHGTDLIMIG